MSVLVKFVLFTMVALISCVACDQSPKPQFYPGDRVRVKLMPQIEGEVALRTRFGRDHLYNLKVAGNYRVHYPIRENEQRAAWMARLGESEYLTPWHYEGPYNETDLELVR